MSAKINNLRSLRKRDFDIIREMSLLGAHMLIQTNNGLSEDEQEAIYNLLSTCSGEVININGNVEYEHSVNLEIVDKYDELNFWSILAKKLAARDTLSELGDVITVGNFKKFEVLKDEFEKQYLKEFNIDKYKKNMDEIFTDLDENFLPY
ncbi:MAG: hypothetical protein ACRC57_04565 [Sarcina sp.]